MSAVTKVHDQTCRTLRYTVAGQAPVTQFDAPPFDPEGVALTITDGLLVHLDLSGVQYDFFGKLGKRKVLVRLYAKDEAPKWLQEILAELGVELPRASA